MSRTAIHLWLALSFVALLAPPRAAHAQWMVLRAGLGDPSPAELELTDRARASLGTLGETARPTEGAATTLQARLSRERTVVEADRIAELVDAVRVLEEHVAMRRREAALEAAERVRELSNGVAEALAEQHEIAQRLFDACVAEAWLHVQLGESEVARADLRRCRESYPDIAVDPHAMSSQVFDLITEIDAELASRPAFQIRITHAPDGCEVSLDGRHHAPTPAPLEGVYSGEHRLEVDCAGVRRVRIHTFLLGAADLSLPIDPIFDDALRTSGGRIWLDYASAADADARRAADAATIGAALDAGDVLVVSVLGPRARLERVEVASGRRLASEEVALDARDAALESALRRLLASTGDGSAGGGPDGELVAGVTLAAVGVAAIGAAWGAYAWRYELGQRVYEVPVGAPDYAQRVSERDDATGLPALLGTVGALAATVSLPFWLPQTDEFPWWSAIPGALGAALIGVGIYQYSGDGRCVSIADGCVQTYATLLSGTLWLESGLPLVAVPIVYAIRAALPADAPPVSASVDVTADHAVVTALGRF